MRLLHVLLPVALLLPSIVGAQREQTSSIVTTQLVLEKGKFFVHILHSASLFGQSVDVRWTAAAVGKPELPSWLHLRHSRHRVLAYLIGTPITPASHVTIHVLARRLDNYAAKQNHIEIALNERNPGHFNRSTQQVVEIRLVDTNMEELIRDQNGRLQRLEKIIHKAFTSKYVEPYIFDMQSVDEPPPPTQNPRQHALRAKEHTTVFVGTQHVFNPAIRNLANALNRNPAYCNRTDAIPIHEHFAREFRVDWCHFRLRNYTQIEELAGAEIARRHKMQGTLLPKGRHSVRKHFYGTSEANPTETTVEPHGYSFFESVLIFPMIAVVCIMLILILSFIFFGRREGQKWRDYKTPREQLEEYMAVRESQRHLRELSVQRQLLLMANDSSSDTSAPKGIHSFLQPRRTDGSSSRGASSTALHGGYTNKSGSRLNESAARSTSIPVGKQTVAEAARQVGSSLHLYRNPMEGASDNEDDDEERNTFDDYRHY